MANEFNYLYLQQFGGGLNTKTDAQQLAPNEATDAQNVRSLTGQELRKRRGYDNLNSTAISDSWTTKTAMTTARSFFALLSFQSFFNCIGGLDAGSSPLDTNEQYNIQLNTWSSKTVYPVAISKSGRFILDQITGYVVSGDAASGSDRIVYQYSLISNTFTSKAIYPNSVSVVSPGGFVINGKGYAAGGLTGTPVTTTNEYNASTNSWSTKTGMSTARTTMGDGYFSGVGHVYAGEGASGQLTSHERYTQSSDTWDSRTAYPATLAGLMSMLLGNFMYGCGGEDTNPTSSAAVYQFSPSGNSWSTKTSMGTARAFGAGTQYGTLGFVVGGDNVASVVSTNEMYTSPPITGLYDFQQSTGKKYKMVGTPKELLYWTGSAFSSLGSSFTGTNFNPWMFSVKDDFLYAVNGADAMQKWDGIQTTTQTVQGNVWRTRATMTNAHGQGPAAWALLRDATTRIYVSTGGGATNTDEFDDISNVWTARVAIGTAGTDVARFTLEGKGYTMGGTSRTTLNHQYDAQANVYTSRAQLPTAKSALAGSGTNTDTKGYTAGGVVAAAQVDTSEEYDPTTNAWTSKAVVSSARQNMTQFTLDGFPYVAGGSTGSVSAITQKFDTVANSWTAKTSMNTARERAAGFSIVDTTSNYLFGYTAGGDTGSDSAVTERYDPSVDTWLSRTALSTAADGGAGAEIGTSGFKIGGGNATTAIEKFFGGNSPPTFKFLVIHKGYAFGAGDPNHPARLYWSALNNPEDWPPLNAEDVLDGGETITAIFVHNGTLYVASSDRIIAWNFADDPSFAERVPLTPGVGIVSQRSIVFVEREDGQQDTYFCAENGFYQFPALYLSEKIEPTFQALNGERNKFISGCHVSKYNEIWWSVTSANGTGSDTILVYNYQMKAWFKFSGINAETLAVIENSVTDLDEIYHGDYAGLVYFHDDTVDSDNGSNIDAYWKTGWLDFAGQNAKLSVENKTLRRVYGYMTLVGSATGNLTVDIYKNISTTADHSPTLSIASTARQYFDTSVEGHMLQLKFSESTTNPFQVNRVALGLLVPGTEAPGT